MSPNLVALLYLVAGVLFVLALRGLSSPETSRRGNYLGMAGMAIAVATTLAVARPSDFTTWAMIIGAIAFTGSVIAFLKLSGRMSGKPIILPARHLINIGLALLLLFCIVMFCR